MLTVFFYARLWRRAGVMTDVEFAELRYSGKPAAFLRGFRALYLGIPINCIILGWVNLAMMKILQVTLGVDDAVRSAVLMASWRSPRSTRRIAGLWGVLVTDMLQFVLKMGMVIVLACLRRAGGRRHRRAEGEGRRRSTPRAGGRLAARILAADLIRAWMPMITLVRLSRRATGGPAGTPAPSLAAAATWRSASSRPRDERHGVLATLWFNIAHYALRPWPWILDGAGLARALPRPRRTKSPATSDVHGPGHVPAGAPRLHDRRLLRRVHVDDRARSSIGAPPTSSTTSIAASSAGAAASGTTSSPRRRRPCC